MAKVRIPIAAPLETREVAYSGSFNTDTMLVNCYIESTPRGKKEVVKRPGLSVAYTYNSGGATNAQGMNYYKGMLFAMGSNTLYRLTGSVNGSADGTAWGASTTAPWQGRTEFGCIIFAGQIFIFGGLSTGGTLPLNDVWSSSDGINWTQLVSAAPWKARWSLQVAIIGDTLYLMGGTDGTLFYNDVWSTTDGVNWTQALGTAPWSTRKSHRCVSFNQGIFLMGGQDSGGTRQNDVWFTTDGITWAQQVLSATWSARMDFGCLVYGGFIWVAGGNTGAGTVATVYKSSDGINWTNTGSLPVALQKAATCVYGNKMWFVGGKNAGAADVSTVYSTSDGATFATPTAAYGGGGLEGAGLVVLRTPTTINTINAPTMWLIGGADVGFRNSIYRATLNTALAASFAISTAGSTTTPFQFTTQNLGDYMVFKNTSDAWFMLAGVVQKITDPNYPLATVPGVVNLDDSTYVMDADGTIFGSDLSTPQTWNALDYLTADYESDAGVAIHKYQNYVAAFKATTLQFFYDAGRTPGSPLLPLKDATARIGCSSAASIVPMENTIIFMAQNSQQGNYIAALNGFMPERISTPDIDRILNAGTPDAFVYAYEMKVNGHPWYVLTFKTNNITIAFDLIEKQWFTLRSLTNYFQGVYYATDGTNNYVQDLLTGTVFSVSPVVYADNGATITVTATGEIVDGGNNSRKFCSRIEVIGDRKSIPGSNPATISWSDDDYQNFSSGISVDLTQARPKVDRCGSFRRRAHRITHASATPFRVEALELTLADA